MTAAVRPVLALLLLAVLFGAAVASARPAGAQTPEPDPPAVETPVDASPGGAGSPAPTGGGPSVLDVLRPILDELTENIFIRALIRFAQSVVARLKDVVADVFRTGSGNFVTQTPPAVSYGHPTVQALAGSMRAVANAALALTVLVAGLNLVVREQIGAPYHAAMALFPRTAMGALLVNTSGWWTRLAVDANNALCAAIGGAELPGFDRVDPARDVFLDLIVFVVYLVTCLLLLLQQLMRLALVDVLLVLAPLGLACWILPQTQSWARLWSSAFLATVFTQFVQVVTLKLGASLLTSGPQAPDAAVVSLLLGLAVVWLTMRIPRLIVLDLESGFGLAGLNSRVPGAVRAARTAFQASAKPAYEQLRFHGKGWG